MPPSKRAKQLGRLVKKYRLDKDISLRKLAEQMGFNHSYLSRLEAGDYESPCPNLLKKLSRALAIPLEDLYALAGYEVPDRLPNFAPYLRTKYSELPDEAVERLEEYFQLLKEKHGVDPEEGGRDA